MPTGSRALAVCLRSAAALPLLLAVPAEAQCKVGTLTHPFEAPGDELGAAIAVDGDVLVAGNPLFSSPLPNGDSVLVWRRVDGHWTFEAELLPSNAPLGQDFGFSVDVAGNTIVVGDPGAPGEAFYTGAAYVFEHDGATWRQTQILSEPGGAFEDQFGFDVALSDDGTRLVVGAPHFSSHPGTVTVFERPAGGGGAFAVAASLTSPGSGFASFWGFGFAVDLSESRIVVGDPAAGWISSSGMTVGGAVYTFRQGSGGGWELEETFQLPVSPPPVTTGIDVSIDDDVLAIVGNRMIGTEPFYALFPASEVGVYRFTEGPGWVPDPVATEPLGSVFGDSCWRVVVEGDWIAVGNPFALNGNGQVKLAHFDGTQWSSHHSIMGFEALDQLGRSVALDDGWLVAGATQTVSSGVSSGPGYVRTWRAPDAQPLVASVSQLSLSAGGTQELWLATCPPDVDATYLMLGSLSGTFPGVHYGPYVLPLNADAYLDFTVQNPNSPHLAGALGGLGSSGGATVRFELPAGSNPAWAGQVVHHAALLYDWQTGFVPTNPVSLQLVP